MAPVEYKLSEVLVSPLLANKGNLSVWHRQADEVVYMVDKTSDGQFFHLTCGNNLCIALFPAGHKYNRGASDVPYQLMGCALKTKEKTNWHKVFTKKTSPKKKKKKPHRKSSEKLSFSEDRQTEQKNEGNNFRGQC